MDSVTAKKFNTLVHITEFICVIIANTLIALMRLERFGRLAKLFKRQIRFNIKDTSQQLLFISCSVPASKTRTISSLSCQISPIPSFKRFAVLLLEAAAVAVVVVVVEALGKVLANAAAKRVSIAKDQEITPCNQIMESFCSACSRLTCSTCATKHKGKNFCNVLSLAQLHDAFTVLRIRCAGSFESIEKSLHLLPCGVPVAQSVTIKTSEIRSVLASMFDIWPNGVFETGKNYLRVKYMRKVHRVVESSQPSVGHEAN